MCIANRTTEEVHTFRDTRLSYFVPTLSTPLSPRRNALTHDHTHTSTLPLTHTSEHIHSLSHSQESLTFVVHFKQIRIGVVSCSEVVYCLCQVLIIVNFLLVQPASETHHTVNLMCDRASYTGCHRRNGPNFGRVFLMLNYTDITQNTYVPS